MDMAIAMVYGTYMLSPFSVVGLIAALKKFGEMVKVKRGYTKFVFFGSNFRTMTKFYKIDNGIVTITMNSREIKTIPCPEDIGYTYFESGMGNVPVRFYDQNCNPINMQKTNTDALDQKTKDSVMQRLYNLGALSEKKNNEMLEKATYVGAAMSAGAFLLLLSIVLGAIQIGGGVA